MNKWIYIKSDRLIDAYVVSSILNNASENEYSIVRRAQYAKLFRNHPSIKRISMYEANEESQLITITPTNVEDFNELTSQISKKLGVEIRESSYYVPSVHDFLDLSQTIIIFMFSDNDFQSPLDLGFIDLVVCALRARKISTISSGTMAIPCIRGCKDYRGLVTWEHLPSIAMKNKSTFIITNDYDYNILCKAIGLKSILLKNEKGTMCADDKIVTHPNELINLIIQQI